MTSLPAANSGRQCRLCSSPIGCGPVCTACQPIYSAYRRAKWARRARASRQRVARAVERTRPCWASIIPLDESAVSEDTAAR